MGGVGEVEDREINQQGEEPESGGGPCKQRQIKVGDCRVPSELPSIQFPFTHVPTYNFI